MLGVMRARVACKCLSIRLDVEVEEEFEGQFEAGRGESTVKFSPGGGGPWEAQNGQQLSF